MTNLTLSPTFLTIRDIIAETCDIPRDDILPESHLINDLGIDSLDALDIYFAIDKAFGIKVPLERWTQEINDGRATTEQYFVLENLASHVVNLVAQKKGHIPEDLAPYPVPPEVEMAFNNMREAYAADHAEGEKPTS